MTEPRPVRLLTLDTIDKRCLVLERMPGEKLCASIRWVPWNKIRVSGVPIVNDLFTANHLACLNPQLFLKTLHDREVKK